MNAPVVQQVVVSRYFPNFYVAMLIIPLEINVAQRQSKNTSMYGTGGK